MKKSNLIIVSQLGREDVTLDEFKKLVEEGKIDLGLFMQDKLEHEDALADCDDMVRNEINKIEQAYLHPQPNKVKILEAQLKKAKEDIKSLEDEKAEAEKKAQEAEKKAQEAEKKAQDAEAKAQDADQKLQAADKKSVAADQKVAEADKKAAEADQKVAEAEKKVQEAEKKAIDADKKASEAEQRVKDLEAQLALSKKSSSAPSSAPAFTGTLTLEPDTIEIEDSEDLEDGKKKISRAFVTYKGKKAINSIFAKEVIDFFEGEFKPEDFPLYFYKTVNEKIKLLKKTGDNIDDV